MPSTRSSPAIIPADGVLVADGFDDALIRVDDGIAVYSVEKCVQVLCDRDDMTREDAWEFFLYNVAEAYMGPKTPIFE